MPEFRAKLLAKIQNHITSWQRIGSHDSLEITKLAGLSNACYKVKVVVTPDNTPTESNGAAEDSEPIEPDAVLFRFFECKLANWEVEKEIFQALSDQDIGP